MSEPIRLPVRDLSHGNKCPYFVGIDADTARRIVALVSGEDMHALCMELDKEKFIRRLEALERHAADLGQHPPQNTDAGPPAPAPVATGRVCSCGLPFAGVVHRSDGPCYYADQPAPAQVAQGDETAVVEALVRGVDRHVLAALPGDQRLHILRKIAGDHLAAIRRGDVPGIAELTKMEHDILRMKATKDPVFISETEELLRGEVAAQAKRIAELEAELESSELTAKANWGSFQFAVKDRDEARAELAALKARKG